MIERWILNYLKKNHICFIKHTKYGKKVFMNFHPAMGEVEMTEFTLEVSKKYDFVCKNSQN